MRDVPNSLQRDEGATAHRQAGARRLLLWPCMTMHQRRGAYAGVGNFQSSRFDLQVKANAMDRSAFLKGAAGGRRQLGALPLSPLPEFVDAAAAQTRNAHQPMQQGPPSTPGISAEPGDLVARALAILAEEAGVLEASQSLAPRSIR
jgi:hypothetical protein